MHFYIYDNNGKPMVTNKKHKELQMVDSTVSYLEALTIARSHATIDSGILIDPEMLQELLDSSLKED